MIAPFIGPVIDRVPGGRRFTVLIVNFLRCITIVAMIPRINSVALFPLAFISLVLARTYSVSKTALVPTLVDDDEELVAANGKLGLLAGLIGFAAVAPAGLLQLIDSRATLMMSATMFALASLASLQLPRHVATTPRTTELPEIKELHGSGIRDAALSMMLLRGVVGFLFFHVAPKLDAMISAIVSYVDYVVDIIATRIIGTGTQIAEAVRRRRVEARTQDQFVEQLLGLRLTKSQLDDGHAFIAGVIERDGFEALSGMWTKSGNLPTPNEVTAPGLWLERINY